MREGGREEGVRREEGEMEAGRNHHIPWSILPQGCNTLRCVMCLCQTYVYHVCIMSCYVGHVSMDPKTSKEHMVQ